MLNSGHTKASAATETETASLGHHSRSPTFLTRAGGSWGFAYKLLDNCLTAYSCIYLLEAYVL